MLHSAGHMDLRGMNTGHAIGVLVGNWARDYGGDNRLRHNRIHTAKNGDG